MATDLPGAPAADTVAASGQRTIGVSIPVPDPYYQQLQQARRESGDPLADAVPPHVTLVPPTPVTEHEQAALSEHLEQVAAHHEPFRMTLGGSGSFRPVSPVVFVAVAEGIGACETLQQKARSGPVQRELQFPYHPHVTIAHGVPEHQLEQAFCRLATFRGSFEVTGFDLYEHGDDQVWRSVRTFRLGGAVLQRR